MYISTFTGGIIIGVIGTFVLSWIFYFMTNTEQQKKERDDLDQRIVIFKSKIKKFFKKIFKKRKKKDKSQKPKIKKTKETKHMTKKEIKKELHKMFED